MSLKENIRSELVADSESILEDNIGKVTEIIKLHADGSINLKPKIRDASGQARVAAYLVGQCYSFEGDLSDEMTLPSAFFYDRLEVSERSVRNYLKELRDRGFVKSPSQGDYQVIVENIPELLSYIEREVSDD